MNNPFPLLGFMHTLISIIALFAAVVALSDAGKIIPSSRAGKVYIFFTILACLTAFPIMKTGHPGPGHALAAMILLLLPLGIFAKSIRLFGNKAEYVQVGVMSTTLFFSLVPAVNETMTRLPVSRPLASGPEDPVLQLSLLTLVALYILGTGYQFRKIRMSRKLAAPAH